MLDVKSEEHVTHECGVAVGTLQINKLVRIQWNGFSGDGAIGVDIHSNTEVLVAVARASRCHRYGSLFDQLVILGSYSVQLDRRLSLNGRNNSANVLLTFSAAGKNGGDEGLLRLSIDCMNECGGM